VSTEEKSAGRDIRHCPVCDAPREMEKTAERGVFRRLVGWISLLIGVVCFMLLPASCAVMALAGPAGILILIPTAGFLFLAKWCGLGAGFKYWRCPVCGTLIHRA